MPAPSTRGETATFFAVMLLIVAGVLAAYWTGVADGRADLPLCEEDEVILTDSTCHPLDDSDYIGGVGWVDDTRTVSQETE